MEKELKGTKTEKNLMEAFAGESPVSYTHLHQFVYILQINSLYQFLKKYVSLPYHIYLL